MDGNFIMDKNTNFNMQLFSNTISNNTWFLLYVRLVTVRVEYLSSDETAESEFYSCPETKISVVKEFAVKSVLDTNKQSSD
jgi:hypothetical protein